MKPIEAAPARDPRLPWLLSEISRRGGEVASTMQALADQADRGGIDAGLAMVADLQALLLRLDATLRGGRPPA